MKSNKSNSKKRSLGTSATFSVPKSWAVSKRRDREPEAENKPSLTVEELLTRIEQLEKRRAGLRRMIDDYVERKKNPYLIGSAKDELAQVESLLQNCHADYPIAAAAAAAATAAANEAKAEGDGDGLSAVFEKPSVSASAIARDRGEILDLFAHVCGPGTYVPNARIQRLLRTSAAEAELAKCMRSMEEGLQLPCTFRGLDEEESEEMVREEVLKCLSEMITDRVNEAEKSYCLWSEETTTEEEGFHLAQSTQAEHCVVLDGRSFSQVVIGSVAKGVEASLRQCYPELLVVCGNSSIALKERGLPREECVVVGVVAAGQCVQFCATYLLEESLPVLVALSPVLCVCGSLEEQRSLAEWVMRCVSFAIETKDALFALNPPTAAQRSQYRSNTDSASLAMRELVKPKLSLRGYFAKPLRDVWNGAGEDALRMSSQVSTLPVVLNRTMRVYERLHSQGGEGVHEYVLFPEGVVGIPGEDVKESQALRALLIDTCKAHFKYEHWDHRPVILFPLLSEASGWNMKKPSVAVRGSYLEKLRMAVAALDRAGVAHMDLRPANVMWRSTADVNADAGAKEGVELRIIDLEHAVFFGQAIPSVFVRSVLEGGDTRYPFCQGDERCVQIASALHNEFFLVAVTKWVQSSKESFADYMAGAGANILAALRDK